jgi:2-polyprenyl-3-methyl-5-hydroxy-6-metoxy-1,4-benzoquinol methylase
MLTVPLSPVTRLPNVIFKASWPIKTIIRRWKEEFDIDVSRHFNDTEELELWECADSKIQFFEPAVIGDQEFYNQLQKNEWYYQEKKWEFYAGLSACTRGDKILEIGCGSGAFLKLARAKGIEIYGLDLNARAASLARAEGLPVYDQDIYQWKSPLSAKFDACFAFQVLEHVADPIRFCIGMLSLVKDGGVVVIAVPNAESFIQHSDTLLDMPPHHVTRWREASIARFATILGVKSRRILKEPLDKIHIPWYMQTVIGRFGKNFVAKGLGNRVTRRIGEVILRGGIRHFITGQTLYAELEKIG